MKILSFKKYFFLVLIYTCVIFSQISNAQSPFVWAQSGINPPNPTSNNEGYAVAVEKKGNVFVTGYFLKVSFSDGKNYESKFIKQ
ncbi:MAG TPA: hypothetical protein VNX01_07155 [Bacteroidia bacterium]|nr:hypothetical protein [Bacteroidia bacterium]